MAQIAWSHVSQKSLITSPPCSMHFSYTALPEGASLSIIDPDSITLLFLGRKYESIIISYRV